MVFCEAFILEVAGLRIHYDHQIFTAQQWGGISRYFVEIAKRIGRRNDVSIHAPIYVSRALASLPSSQHRGMLAPSFAGITKFANAVALATRSSRACDIYHPTWYRTTTWRPRRARLVQTVYDMIPERFPELHPLYPAHAALKRHALAEAELIFCISESTKRDLVEIAGMSPANISVTYMGTAIQEVVPANLQLSYPYILYVGQRGGYKNFLSLFRAFEQSSVLRRGFGLVCMGGGEFTPQERQVMGDYLAGGVGGVQLVQGGDSVLAAVYRSASVFACPSLYEGFGIPVVEAMACGCPVVATNVSSLPEIGGEAIFYSEDASAEALRYSLESLLLDSAGLLQQAKEGLVRAARFTWESTAAATLAGYRSIS